jgi:hypothetical protein
LAFEAWVFVWFCWWWSVFACMGSSNTSVTKFVQSCIAHSSEVRCLVV